MAALIEKVLLAFGQSFAFGAKLRMRLVKYKQRRGEYRFVFFFTLCNADVFPLDINRFKVSAVPGFKLKALYIRVNRRSSGER